MQKLRSKADLSGEALQKKALDEMCLPAVGCFVAGTLVHTKDGLKPIEQIKIGDWVLSRPESPEQGTETGYKRVTKTFRFEDKEVVRFWWAPNSQAAWEQTEWVYATPNHPVWLNPHGWVAMGRLHLPGKLRPGTIHRGDDEWLSRELILADGSSGAMLDVMDLFCTDQQEVAFLEDDDPDWGVLVDFSCPVASIIPEELAYDYEKWADPTNETRARYTTTVYNFEVEDWHTYFVGKMGVWVHNTNCLEARESGSDHDYALIDKGAVGEFAERLFKPSLDQVMQELREQSKLSGEALQKKALDELRLPAIGCFVAGTLVHTKEGLKPIEQIKVGDWVLSRPENPEQGTETGYKRVTKTFRFEDKEVVRFWWERSGNTDQCAPGDSVYVTPNHPVWLNPHGWVAMGRLHLPGKGRPGTIHRGDDEWLNKELVLADGSSGAMLDVFDLYRTDRPEIAFHEEDGWGYGALLDFAQVSPVYGEDLTYDYENWGDPVNETRERYTTTVYNIEVEDWHTYFVGKTGLWVHNTNCLEATLEVAPGKGDVDELIKGALQFGNESQFKHLTKAELNHFLGKPGNSHVEGFAIIRMDGGGKYLDYELAQVGLPNGLKFEDDGLGRLIDKGTGMRYGNRG